MIPDNLREALVVSVLAVGPAGLAANVETRPLTPIAPGQTTEQIHQTPAYRRRDDELSVQEVIHEDEPTRLSKVWYQERFERPKNNRLPRHIGRSALSVRPLRQPLREVFVGKRR